MNDPVHFTTLGEDIHHIILAQVCNKSNYGYYFDYFDNTHRRHIDQ